MVMKEAKKQKSALKKELARKFVHLKLDAHTTKTTQEEDFTPGTFFAEWRNFCYGGCRNINPAVWREA